MKYFLPIIFSFLTILLLSIICSDVTTDSKLDQSPGEEDVCQICKGKFKESNREKVGFHNNPLLYTTKVNHYCHRNCIKKYQKNTCPECREPKNNVYGVNYLMDYCESSSWSTLIKVQVLRLNSIFHWLLDTVDSDIPKIVNHCLLHENLSNLKHLLTEMKTSFPHLLQISLEIVSKDERCFIVYAKFLQLDVLLNNPVMRLAQKQKFDEYLKANDEYYLILYSIGFHFKVLLTNSCYSTMKKSDNLEMQDIFREMFSSDLSKEYIEQLYIALYFYYLDNKNPDFSKNVETVANSEVIERAKMKLERFPKRYKLDGNLRI